MRNRRRRISGTGGAVGGQLLSLSLFIMLLAFFIILNSISQREQSRADPVLQSLESTFSSKVSEQENRRPSVTESVEQALDEGDTLDRLENLFSSQIPSNRAKVDKRTGTMYVELPFGDFESAVMSLGHEAPGKEDEGQKEVKGFFLPALVALMKNEGTRPYHVEIFLHTAENPAGLQNSRPQFMHESARRMAALAGKIESAGLPEKLMNIGFRKGSEDTVSLFFRPHIPYNPLERDNAGE